MFSSKTSENITGTCLLLLICTLVSGLLEKLILSCISYYKSNDLDPPSMPIYFYYHDLDKSNLPFMYIFGAGLAFIGVYAILTPIYYLLKFRFVAHSSFSDRTTIMGLCILTFLYFIYYYYYAINTIKVPRGDKRYKYLKKYKVTFPPWN